MYDIIYLEHSQIGEEGMKMLTKSKWPSLKLIDLSKINLTQETIIQIVTVLPTSTATAGKNFQ